MENRYKLGIYSTREIKYYIDLKTNKTEYIMCMIVDKSMIDFLEMHDITIKNNGDRVYVVNEIEYINLGEYKDGE